VTLPDTLNPLVPSDTGIVALGPAQIRAIAQFLADVFGVPVSPVAVTGQAFSITPAGVVTISQPGASVTADPTTALGIATKEYVDNAKQAASIPFAVVSNGGAGTAYNGSSSPAITAYVPNQLYIFQFQQAIPQGGTPVTINLNSLGAITVKKGGNFNTPTFDLGQGDIPAGGMVLAVYDGFVFQLYAGAANAGAVQGWPHANATNPVSPFNPIPPSNGWTWVYNSTLGMFIPGVPGSAAGGYLSVGFAAVPIKSTNFVTLATLALTAPSTGGPFRIKTGYYAFVNNGADGNSCDFQVSDGTNQMAFCTVGIPGNANAGANAFDFSPTTYGNAATVTLTLQAQAKNSADAGGNSAQGAMASIFKAIFEPSN